MNSSIGKKLAGVALGALFVAGLGGAGLAYAQTTDNNGSSTTTNPPAATQDSPHCHHGGGGGGGGGGGASSGSTSPAPSTGNPGSV